MKQISPQAIVELDNRIRQLERVKPGESPIITNKTVAASATTGIKGEIAWDSSYLYVCVATNTWRRVALSSF